MLMGTQTSANIKSYAEIVREKSIMRRLIKVNEEGGKCLLSAESAIRGDPFWKMHRSRFLHFCRDWEFRRVCTDQAGCTQCIGVIERASKTKESEQEFRQDSLILIISCPVCNAQTLY